MLCGTTLFNRSWRAKTLPAFISSNLKSALPIEVRCGKPAIHHTASFKKVKSYWPTVVATSLLAGSETRECFNRKG